MDSSTHKINKFVYSNAASGIKVIIVIITHSFPIIKNFITTTFFIIHSSQISCWKTHKNKHLHTKCCANPASSKCWDINNDNCYHLVAADEKCKSLGYIKSQNCSDNSSFYGWKANIQWTSCDPQPHNSTQNQLQWS